MGRVAAAAAAAQPIRVTAEQRDKRSAECTACENLIGNRCKLCGCNLQAKLQLATEKCPIGKWLEIV